VVEVKKAIVKTLWIKARLPALPPFPATER
jgi:hypothetical protein